MHSFGPIRESQAQRPSESIEQAEGDMIGLIIEGNIVELY
jgi:hypothetical protein